MLILGSPVRGGIMFSRRWSPFKLLCRPQEAPGVLLTLARFGFTCLALGASSLLHAAPLVRVGYVVPQNRTPQEDAVGNLRELIISVQDWYGDQMARYGFGPKTFQFETEPDGVTPKIHVVPTPVTDATIRTDVWSRTIDAATGAGLPIWSSSQVWLLIPEAHLQNANGSISGGTALGASFGSGTDAGVAMLGSDLIFKATPSSLEDKRPYQGLTIPEIGPHPLVQGVSFPSFEGSTVSSTASSGQGATAHELGHAFGLGHDFRNDENFDGILMGNGLRGWRGSRLPEEFPNDDVQLSYAAALALNTSRYFNPSQTAGETTRPVLNVQTSGSVSPVNGLLQVSFTANDATGLAAALLRRNGETIGELSLTGNAASTSFMTPYYTPGQNDNFTVSVYDVFGNRRDVEVAINVATGFNRAPQPYIDLNRATVSLGQPAQLTAAQSTDPGGSTSSVQVEWDFNSDGVFDTEPTTTKTLTRVFDAPGNYRITARLTDAQGAASVSAPIVLHVAPMINPADFDDDGDVDGDDFVAWRGGFGLLNATRSQGDADGDLDVDGNDFLVWQRALGSGTASTPAVSVPEPLSLLPMVVAVGVRCRKKRARNSQPSEIDAGARFYKKDHVAGCDVIESKRVADLGHQGVGQGRGGAVARCSRQNASARFVDLGRSAQEILRRRS
jgi:hypothetical protein